MPPPFTQGRQIVGANIQHSQSTRRESERESLVQTSSAKILRNFCEIHLPRRRTLRRVCGMTLKVAPWAQMMYGFAVMMLPSANDVGLRPMMLRRCRKLMKLFAPQKATLTFCASKIFHISQSEIFHICPKGKYFTRRSRISLKTRSVFSAPFYYFCIAVTILAAQAVAGLALMFVSWSLCSLLFHEIFSAIAA